MASKHGKAWRARWTDENGKRQSRSFKYHRDAEQFERQQKSEVEQVRCGLRKPKPIDRTFKVACDYWEKNVVPLKKSGENDISILRKHLRPASGRLLLRELETGTARVDRFILQFRQTGNGDKTLNNVLTLLTSVLRKAVDLGWMAATPKIRKPRIRAISSDFSYLRTTDEIRRFLAAADEEGEMVYMLYLTAIYTGLRAGELAGLRWDDVDLERRLITVQRSYSGTTKAGDARYVPIVNALHGQLRSWRLRHPGNLVFTNRAGRMIGKSARITKQIFHRVVDSAGFPTRQRRNGKTRRYITFHDLRHTFASHWMTAGGDLFKLQNILGHKTTAMTLRYSHLAPNAFAADWDRFPEIPKPGSTEVATLPLAEQPPA